MKRAFFLMNGSDANGIVILIPDAFENLLSTATKEFGIPVKRIFTKEGFEIDDIELISDDEVIYVSSGDSFINLQKTSSEPREQIKRIKLSGLNTSFETVLKKSYFVDKTLMMKEIVDLCGR